MIQLNFLIFQNSYLVFFIFQNRQMLLKIQTHKCILTFIYKFIATVKAAFYTLHTDYNPQNICFESPFKNVDNEASEPSGQPLMAQKVKHLSAMQKTRVQSLGQEDSPGEGNGNPLQYSCLANPVERRVWWAPVHGVKKNQTQLSD